MFMKMPDYRPISQTANNPILSTILFIAIFFLIFSGRFISNLEMQSPLQSALSNLPLVTKQGKMEEVESNSADPLIPPFNITWKARMAWFQRKLPQLDILNSDTLSQKFHGRVLEFFNNKCTVHFHMIWLSPARTFGPKEFLAMDTLFKTNPNACLIIVSRSMDSRYGYKLLKPIHDLSFKVLVVTPDMPFLIKNTPAETWLNEMKSGRKDPGYIPLSINLSNLIRVAMLYKYGGIYLDTDVIVLKDFVGLRNVVGTQSTDSIANKRTRINNAVMIFDMNHPLLADILKEFATTFNGNKWGHNGPYLLSRVIERVRSMPGYNFTVLPPTAFYPVDWIKIRMLFHKPNNERDSEWVEETLLRLRASYALHLWNKKSRELIIEEGSVIDRLISDHCVICQHIYRSRRNSL